MRAIESQLDGPVEALEEIHDDTEVNVKTPSDAWNILLNVMNVYCIVLYCIWLFIKRFSQQKPFRSAPSASNPMEKAGF